MAALPDSCADEDDLIVVSMQNLDAGNLSKPYSACLSEVACPVELTDTIATQRVAGPDTTPNLITSCSIRSDSRLSPKPWTILAAQSGQPRQQFEAGITPVDHSRDS